MKQRTGVKALVRRGGQTLLLRRAHGRASIMGQFEIPGGKIGYGEQPEDALRRYQEKEKRQYLRNSGDDRRIIFITGVTDIGIPAQHIDIRLLDLVDLLLRIRNLFLCICGLFIQCL